MALNSLIDTARLQAFGENAVVPIKKSIAPTEVSPARAAHAVGDYIMYGGSLYKVTSAISIGDTLTVNANIAKTDVVSEMGQGSAITVDDAMSATSENPVQNKVVKAALDGKVDVVSGKGLSSNDYTTTEKNKLAGLDNAIMECEDVTNSVTYDVKFQLYQGKPRLVYEEQA